MITFDSTISRSRSLPFTRSLADAGEHRKAFAADGDVVDQLHDQDGLADAGTAEEADLSAAKKRLNKVDDLDARFEHLKRCRLLVKRRSVAMDRSTRFALTGPELVNRIADDVHHAAQVSHLRPEP